MTVNVVYEGLSLAEGAETRAVPAGLFVPLPAPMPVGTRLEVVFEGARTEARVVRVQEAGESGVVLVDDAGRPLRLVGLKAPEAAAGGASAAGQRADHPAAMVELEADSDEELDAATDPGSASAVPAADANARGDEGERAGGESESADSAESADAAADAGEKNGDPEASKRSGARRRRTKKGRAP